MMTKPRVDRTERKFRRTSQNRVLGGVMAGVTLLALLYSPARAVALVAPLTNVMLAWDRSPSPDVVGYRIYYGIASGSYTNSVMVGNVTNCTVSNLVNGVTYFFASKAYTASGIESSFSNEALFVPGGAAILQLTMTANKQAVLALTGRSGRTYEIQSSTNLASWNVIGSVTVGSNGTATYTDTSVPGYSKRYYRTRDTTP